MSRTTRDPLRLRLPLRLTLAVAVAMAMTVVAGASAASSSSSSAVPKRTVHGECAVNYHGACKCTVDECDAPEPLGTLAANDIAIYSTTLSGDRLKRTVKKFDATATTSSTVKIGYDTPLQSIVGVGTAFTDAMAVNVGAMTADIQELILENYYGATGLGYALGRIPIASCDFSTHMYSYNDLYGDYQMTNFSVDVDVASGKIGMIQKALSLRQEALQAGLFSAPLGPIDDAALGPVGVLTNNHSMVLFASSWSPPAWLKTTQSRVKGSLNGTAGDAVHKAYALYLSKFLDAYAAHGIEVAYLSMQNEPSMSVRWDSCFFSPVTERDFIKTDLGPLMRQNHPDVGLIMLDDQRLEMDIWLDIVLSDADAAQYVNVTGMHWYSSANDVLDEFQYLRYAHDKYPNMLLLATEACAGEEVIDRGVVFGSWYRGITYFKDISGDFNNWAIGWTDWPGVVDLQGGPNHAGNWVDSAIVANTTAGTEFYKNPMFYALGHFSLFAPANSSRLEVTVQYGPDQPNTLKLEITAFLRPDGLVSVMIGNTDEIHPRAISIAHPTQGYINLVVPNASMQTLVFKL